MVRLTELHIHIPLIHEEDLQGLTRLQRLALQYAPAMECHMKHIYPPGTTYHPFVFPEAASITWLRFTFGEDANEVGKRSMLQAVVVCIGTTRS